MMTLLVTALRFLFLVLLVVILYVLVRWMVSDLRRVSLDLPEQDPAEGKTGAGALPTREGRDRGAAGLVVLAGDLPGLKEGDSFSCGAGELLIGRSEHNQVVITGAYASARHARLYYHDGQYWLEDLESTNGTYINDSKLKLPIVLVDGDMIRIGKVTFQFVRWTYEVGPDH